MPRLALDSPVGRLSLVEEDGKLASVGWGGHSSPEATPFLREAARQLAAYFAGELRDFDLPLAPAGTPFDLRVWEVMSEIPYGKTRSYGELARDLGALPQAIGQACGRNPLPIIVPCHRVLGRDGGLGGYSGRGGIETKRHLLVLEGALLL